MTRRRREGIYVIRKAIEDGTFRFEDDELWQRYLVGVEYVSDGDMVPLFEWRKVAE